MSNVPETNKILQSRKVNALLRAYDVQKDYKANKAPGVPDTYFWKNYIFPKYRISKSLFSLYLSTNVHQELKRLGIEPEKILG